LQWVSSELSPELHRISSSADEKFELPETALPAAQGFRAPHTLHRSLEGPLKQGCVSDAVQSQLYPVPRQTRYLPGVTIALTAPVSPNNKRNWPKPAALGGGRKKKKIIQINKETSADSNLPASLEPAFCLPARLCVTPNGKKTPTNPTEAK